MGWSDRWGMEFMHTEIKVVHAGQNANLRHDYWMMRQRERRKDNWVATSKQVSRAGPKEDELLPLVGIVIPPTCAPSLVEERWCEADPPLCLATTDSDQLDLRLPFTCSHKIFVA